VALALEEGQESALIPTTWWEVAGLRDGTWSALYQAKSKAEGKFQMRHVVGTWSSDPIHRRYEDFQLLEPTARVTGSGKVVPL
jgi:hypothetical protein